MTVFHLHLRGSGVEFRAAVTPVHRPTSLLNAGVHCMISPPTFDFEFEPGYGESATFKFPVRPRPPSKTPLENNIHTSTCLSTSNVEALTPVGHFAACEGGSFPLAKGGTIVQLFPSTWSNKCARFTGHKGMDWSTQAYGLQK